MNINIQNHLDNIGRINLGAFYTPYKYVKLVAEWLKNIDIDNSYIIIDTTCGYGAFFELSKWFPNNKYYGNDIDKKAIEFIPNNFPFVKLFNVNSLKNVSRKQYGFNENDKIIIVGNPPYNDTTSIINHNIKNSRIEIDSDIKTRDLGMSSLLSYNKLATDYVAILHPLSYLIKRSNFSSCFRFFNNYKIINHIIFSSSEFEGTSKLNSFPIFLALYKREPNNGLNYDKVYNMYFKTVEGKSFSLKDRDYIANYIDKYPGTKRYNPEILFYTLRDINALKRSRTFIKDRVANAVDVNPKKLVLYCYLDCFKRFANVPYYMGNFDVPFIKENISNIYQDLIDISFYNHQDIFGYKEKPTEDSINKVVNYINNVLKYD